MLELEDQLPAGALLGSARAAFRDRLAGTSAIWFEGIRDAFETDPKTGAIAVWNANTARYAALPAEPNEGHGTLAEADDLIGLSCRDGVNCGLVAAKVIENAASFTMAVIYLPHAERPARTLLSVNTGYSGGEGTGTNYLFLSDGGDSYTVKDTGGAVDLTMPVAGPPGHPRMVVVTLSGDTLAVAENLLPPVVMRGADPGMGAAADLFIGCRSHRRGLKKTLGDAVILDVLLWPDHRLLLPGTEADSAAYLDLRRFFLWGY